MPRFSFVQGSQYSRREVCAAIGLGDGKPAGDATTGYFSQRGAFFIFCGIGTGGRTGHNYGNYFDGPLLNWSGKTRSHRDQPRIRAMIAADAEVHVFHRASDRDPFTYAGVGSALSVSDDVPVRVIWSFELTSPSRKVPEGITREHVLAAIREFDNGIAHQFGPSTRYDLVAGERRYPPKAILGLAAKHASGVLLEPQDFAGGEQSKCFRILRALGFRVVPKVAPAVYPDEVSGVYEEGVVTRVVVNRYERDPKAREKCIEHYGASCQVCSFDFAERFGELGRGFIHVHHLVPISAIKAGYQVNPVTDLRPVCPNCHAMLHKKSPPVAIEVLREIYSRPWP